MSKKQTIPRHDPPTSEEQVWMTLATPREWFETGSFLYCDALRSRLVLDDLPTQESTIVGRPVDMMVDHSGLTRSRQEGVAAMLFAFAVECWLKGLAILNQYPNVCRVQMPLKKALDTALLDRNEDDGEDLTVAIGRFLESEEGQKILADTHQEKANIMAGIKDLIKKNGRHDLVHLAHDAGLHLNKSPKIKDFLELLSSMNMQGRYPCHRDPNKVIPWAGVAGDHERWNALCDAIFKCYEEHVHLLV